MTQPLPSSQTLIGASDESLLIGWWGSWSSTLYRAFQVKNRYGRTIAWRGPVKQTRDQAATFALDLQESNWDKTITTWTYENGRWRVGV